MRPAVSPAPAGTRGPVSVHPWAYPHDEVVRRFDVDPLNGLTNAEALRRRGALGPNLVGGSGDDADEAESIEEDDVPAAARWAEFRARAAHWPGLRALIGRRTRDLPALPVDPTPMLTARVLREDRVVDLPASYVVPGDIILLAQGDWITADARLLDVVEMRVDEGPVTGMRVSSPRCVAPVGNSWTPIGDRWSMVHAGSRVVHGAGTAVVVATGPLTAIGRAWLQKRTSRPGSRAERAHRAGLARD